MCSGGYGLVTLTKNGDIKLTKEYDNLRAQLVALSLDFDGITYKQSLDTVRLTLLKLPHINQLYKRGKYAQQPIS